jgi:60 kDa SS-A/Ro ribonucleoprotein
MLFDNRNFMRIAHIHSKNTQIQELLNWAVAKEPNLVVENLTIKLFEQAQTATAVSEILLLVKTGKLPHEAIDDKWLSSKETHSKLVWRALLGMDGSLSTMPYQALIRNLPILDASNVLSDVDAQKLVIDMLRDKDAILKSRLHPIKIMQAILGYKQGTNRNLTWTPKPRIIGALEDAFELSFGNVVPMKLRIAEFVDVSGSMTNRAQIMGVNLPASEVAALQTMMSVKSGGFVDVFAFTTQVDSRQIPLTTNSNWISTLSAIRASRIYGGSTDLAAPVQFLLDNNLQYDVIIIHTDNETWAGYRHGASALKEYRNKYPNTKLVVASYTANEWSQFDNSDLLSLNVVGFDPNVPAVIREFCEH